MYLSTSECVFTCVVFRFLFVTFSGGQELWVEPQHHMGQETTAIDVKDLLAAAPVRAPTLEQLTSEISDSTRVSFCLLYTSPSPRDRQKSRMPSSA